MVGSNMKTTMAAGPSKLIFQHMFVFTFNILKVGRQVFKLQVEMKEFEIFNTAESAQRLVAN